MSEPDLQSTLELVQAQLNQNTLLMLRARERIAALEAQIQVLQQAAIEQSGRVNDLRAALREAEALGKYWQARAIKAEGIPAAIAEGRDK